MFDPRTFTMPFVVTLRQAQDERTTYQLSECKKTVRAEPVEAWAVFIISNAVSSLSKYTVGEAHH